MTLVAALDILALIPLGWVLYLLWKDRRTFRSLLPIIVGVAFLLVARFSEVLVEHPALHIATLCGFSGELYVSAVMVVGGFADVLGVLFLVIGFVHTIRAQRAQQKMIHDLESLLPICAGCKRYRSQDGLWHPIEKYLLDSGSPQISHALCPTCATEATEEIEHLKQRRALGG